MAKIVIIDNYNRDHVSDVLYMHSLSEETAKDMVKTLNESEGQYSSIYYVVKPDDYELYKFEP